VDLDNLEANFPFQIFDVPNEMEKDKDASTAMTHMYSIETSVNVSFQAYKDKMFSALIMDSGHEILISIPAFDNHTRSKREQYKANEKKYNLTSDLQRNVTDAAIANSKEVCDQVKERAQLHFLLSFDKDSTYLTNKLFNKKLPHNELFPNYKPGIGTEDTAAVTTTLNVVENASQIEFKVCYSEPQKVSGGKEEDPIMEHLANQFVTSATMDSGN